MTRIYRMHIPFPSLKSPDGQWRDYEIRDDGISITAPSDWPAGGSRRIIAPSGDWEHAERRMKSLEFPYWIGVCGYCGTPDMIRCILPAGGAK